MTGAFADRGWIVSLASTSGNFWPVEVGLKPRGVPDRAFDCLNLAERDRERPEVGQGVLLRSGRIAGRVQRWQRGPDDNGAPGLLIEEG